MHGVEALSVVAGSIAIAAYVPDFKEVKDILEMGDISVGALNDVVRTSEATAVRIYNC